MWSEILTVANEIYTQVNAAKSNQKQFQLLAERIRILLSAIEGSGDIKDNEQFDEPLQNLLNTLKKSKELLVNFQDNNWLLRFAKARGYKNSFKEIREQLEDVVSDLNLGVAMQTVMNREKDQLAFVSDMTDLKQSLSELEGLEQKALTLLSEIKLDSGSTEEQMRQMIRKLEQVTVLLETYFKNLAHAARATHKVTLVESGATVEGDLTDREIEEQSHISVPHNATEQQLSAAERLSAYQSSLASKKRQEENQVNREKIIVATGALIKGSVLHEEVGFGSKVTIRDESLLPTSSAASQALQREANKRSSRSGSENEDVLMEEAEGKANHTFQ